jgi:hypothetical protein
MTPRPRCFSLGACNRADATRGPATGPHMTHFFDPEYGRRKSFTTRRLSLHASVRLGNA